MADGIIRALEKSGYGKALAENARRYYDENYSRPIYDEKIRNVLKVLNSMCGIVGIAVFNGGPQPTYEQLQTMCNTLVHRGPDEAGMDIRDKVAIGMRRLSIIDLSGGSQPIFNEDRSIRTVFNGEIYNFRELRRILEARGHAFKTHSDTEVIVHSYEEYGSDFPKYLNGMFAFAVHDLTRRKLVLVRDHIGIKPLFYAFGRDWIVWGSEIKAILASRLIERRLDVDALGEFLAWEYVPGARTLFEGIRKLEPGQMIEIDLDRPVCKPRPYWDVRIGHEGDAKSPEDWEEEVDQTTPPLCPATACQRCSLGGLPLRRGGFLTGGGIHGKGQDVQHWFRRSQLQ